jgi:hypothetical protein
MAVMGAGLGSSMQILMLIVQNEFPHQLVGTATAASNYFRQVGSSLGSAVVGSMFVARLTTLIAERMPAAAGASSGSKSLTPALVNSLPAPIRLIIVQSYNDALVPIFVFMVPLGLFAALLLAFIKETPLATEIQDEVAAESLAEGQVLITELDENDLALTSAASRS